MRKESVTLNPKAIRVTLKALGAFNLIFTMVGVYSLATTSISFYFKHPAPGIPSYPYEPIAFWIMTSFNLLFLAVLGISGVALARSRLEIISLCVFLFRSMLVYIVIVLFISSLVGTTTNAFVRTIAGVTAISNVGIGPQILTGYPIIALIALSLIRRKLRYNHDIDRDAGPE